MPRRRGLSPRRFVSTACSLRYGDRRNRIGKARKNSCAAPKTGRAGWPSFLAPAAGRHPFLPSSPFIAALRRLFLPAVPASRFRSFFFGRKGRLPRRFRRFEVHFRENSSFLSKRNFPGKASERACPSAPRSSVKPERLRKEMPNRGKNKTKNG